MPTGIISLTVLTYISNAFRLLSLPINTSSFFSNPKSSAIGFTTYLFIASNGIPTSSAVAFIASPTPLTEPLIAPFKVSSVASALDCCWSKNDFPTVSTTFLATLPTWSRIGSDLLPATSKLSAWVIGSDLLPAASKLSTSGLLYLLFIELIKYWS